MQNVASKVNTIRILLNLLVSNTSYPIEYINLCELVKLIFSRIIFLRCCGPVTKDADKYDNDNALDVLFLLVLVLFMTISNSITLSLCRCLSHRRYDAIFYRVCLCKIKKVLPLAFSGYVATIKSILPCRHFSTDIPMTLN